MRAPRRRGLIAVMWGAVERRRTRKLPHSDEDTQVVFVSGDVCESISRDLSEHNRRMEWDWLRSALTDGAHG